MTKLQILTFCLCLAFLGVFAGGMAMLLAHFRPAAKPPGCNRRCGQVLGADGNWQDVE